MGQLSKKLRSTEDGSVTFWCQGCQEAHTISVGAGPGPRWGYNGNPDAPTFTPSILVRTGHHVPNFAEKFLPGVEPSCWCTYNAEHPDETDPFYCMVCHSFVTDGMIQFLGDSTHALAGQTVPLADFPEHYG